MLAGFSISGIGDWLIIVLLLRAPEGGHVRLCEALQLSMNAYVVNVVEREDIL